MVSIYSGKSQVSQWERLLVAHPSLPFNGQGSMRRAMTGAKAGGFKSDVKKKAKALDLNLAVPKQSKEAEAAVQKDMDGERLSLIAWVKAEAGPDKQAYDDDSYVRGPKLAAHPITARYLNDDGSVKIKTIIHDRCERCHTTDGGGPGSLYPLENFDQITAYTSVEKSTGKSLPKLAMTTHIHLLSFAMLYALTGLILALSSCPAWLRIPIAPMALLASVVDVAFWWLARLEDPYGPTFARLIPVTGAVLAVSLLLQIILSLFSMFGGLGKFLLVLLFLATGAGGYVVYDKYIAPHIALEKQMKQAVEE